MGGRQWTRRNHRVIELCQSENFIARSPHTDKPEQREYYGHKYDRNSQDRQSGYNRMRAVRTLIWFKRQRMMIADILMWYQAGKYAPQRLARRRVKQAEEQMNRK